MRQEESIRTQEPGRPWRRVLAALDRLIAPLAVFVALYIAALSLLLPYVQYVQWTALVSVVLATATTIALWDRGRWGLGFFVPPPLALREAAGGVGVAVLLVGGAALLVVLTTGMRHHAGSGFPAGELLATFLPAALHEELLFRGYPFQRLWRWKPWLAVTGVSAAFAALHGWNTAVTPLALVNIFLGGVLLSLAYARYERLWFPIGLHFGWNVMSGPVLGYPVSGYAPATSVLTVEGRGPEILTGGGFGIEGSAWMTVVEVAAIAILARRVGRNS
ncbi:MAG TPA: type II CAAX endopeptidase family protein [Thermoanaerobaculia bacterium]|nr:type II CAAX endopeptidase family protein [Thermoanaerobaculia bacterium]